jgi:Mn2+/Fe2+ NRAMP family transporter
MTVRLGAVTKRGHAEAIFDGFGAFWGWFSLLDLMIVDWLTLVTEFIGMTAALAIFGVPPWITVVAVIVLMASHRAQRQILDLREARAAVLRLNLIYIPGAFMVHPSVRDVLHQGLIPNFAGASTASCSSS